MTALTLRAEKYHALGNDFLITTADPALVHSDPGLVARVCDRRRGIGADGIIFLALAARSSPSMVLYNSDGTPAETSGNGLRCVALYLAHSGVARSPSVAIESGGRLLEARVGDRLSSSCAEVTVSMGEVTVSEDGSAADGRGVGPYRAFAVAMGNSHLVLFGRLPSPDELEERGRLLVAARPGGQNVEFAELAADGVLALRVFERGAGVTEACGSGSCAAAAAARLAGLVGDVVAVENPGGLLTVELEGELASPTVRLTGPACRVGSVEMNLEEGAHR